MRLTRLRTPGTTGKVQWSSLRPRLTFVLVVGAVLAYEAQTMFSPSSGIRAAGQRPYVIRDFASGEPVGQTFQILDEALESVDVQLLTERPASIDIACRLLVFAPYVPNDGSGQWAAIYEWRTTFQLPRGRSWHHFTFKPILPSLQQVYQFQVEQLDVRSLDPKQPGRPAVGVVASEEDSLKEGNIIIGKQQVIDRDLFFGAHTASVFTQFRLRANPSLPRPLRSRGVQVGIVVVYNWARAVLVFHSIIRATEQDERDRKEHRAP